MAYIGLDIGGTKVLAALFENDGTIIDKAKKKTKANEGLEKVEKQIKKVINILIEEHDVELNGIGVGVPGIVLADGTVSFSPNLPFKDFKLSEILNKEFGVPVVVGNDVNVGTFGEYRELGIEHANVIGLFPGTGLGGAIIIDGELYIGQGAAGELGHMIVETNGVKCGCGNNGCLESYASKKGIETYLRTQIARGRETTLKDVILSGEVIKSSQLLEAYEAKDELAVEAVKQAAMYLGIGIGNFINIFHPDLFILGGGLIESFDDMFLKEIKEAAKDVAMPGLFDTVKIRTSKLADHAGIVGAYHLIKHAVEK